MTSPVAFLSYAHVDDQFHDGAITTLREKLSLAVQVKTGKPFPIFQDHEGIDWGERWPKVLDAKLAEVRFLIAVMSPSFFASEWCRKELGKFLAIEAEQGRDDLILPIYLEETLLLDNQAERLSDPLAKAIHERQYYDWRPFRYRSFADYEVRLALDKMATGFVKALRRPVKSAGGTSDAKAQPLSSSVEDGAPSHQPAALPGDDKAKANVIGMSDRTNADISMLKSKIEDIASRRQRRVGESSGPEIPEPGTVFREIDEPWCPQMVVIPASSFIMGSPRDEEGRDDDEEPEHRVHIAKTYALGVFSVTFDEFDHFCIETGRRKPGDEGWGRGLRPVINVNVEDAEAYLAWLSGITNQTYCLPSEAMWEYACRAGTRTPFWTGETVTTDQANHDGNHPYGDAGKGQSRLRTTEFGAFPANPFSLYDMHGNVWEWCADPYRHSYDGAPTDGSAWLKGGDSNRRVLRGGSWYSNARSLRSARRGWLAADYRDYSIGFRCARVQA